MLKKPQANHLDTPEASLAHKSIIQKKGFLRALYSDWYHSFKQEIPGNLMGKVLELGSGGGFLKKFVPEVITSDVMPLPEVDVICRAEKLPFKDESLKAIFMLDVLHHIPDVRKFFTEAQRTLAIGGIAYMIEPANTPCSRAIYSNFHHEPFDYKTKSWEFDSTGPLSSSNQALPWIVFHRDRAIFEKEYPHLDIVNIRLHTPFRYILSGGLSYKSFLPEGAFKTATWIERKTKFINPLCAMFQTIILQKKD